MERMNRSELFFKIAAYILIGAFALVALYPIVYAVSASISGKLAFETGQVVLWPKDVNFEVYKVIFNRKELWTSYTNTLFYTVFGVAWSMIISTMGAYALSKSRLIYRRGFNFLLVFTMWFSAGMIPTYLNYKSMGVANRWGMIFAFGIQAFNIILLRNYFESVPKEIEEAAKIDGASEFQLFTQIYLPMSKAALATVTLFYAASRWNGYFWSMLLLESKWERPLQVFMREEIENYQDLLDTMGNVLPYAFDSYVYAIIVASIIPILVVYPYIQKYFAKGVNLGGVKG